MKNKTILITGGTTGIGLATAQLLSAEGAKVVVTGRNPETLAAAKKILPGVVVLASDAGDLGAAQALGEDVKKHAARLDGAFLNAGIATFVPILKKVGLPPEQQKAFADGIVGKSLLKRFGTSDEVAQAARFLLSEDSSNIVGTELVIDGGVRLN
jgi:NAD(P)-dependent dehydrogenase (short-subunit alcohol dehydrogenase family)